MVILSDAPLISAGRDISNSVGSFTNEVLSITGKCCILGKGATVIRPESESRSVRLFYSYSHKDEAYRDELEEHLSLLKRQGLIHTWHDRRIGAGEEWQGAIDESFEAANVILFLVSAAFLASDYCYDREMKRALEKHEAGDARVIPIIIRPVDWSGAPFSKLQALPKDAKPVTSWPNRDEAWADVAKGVRKAIGELLVGAQEKTTEGQAKADRRAGAESERVERKQASGEETKRQVPEKASAEPGNDKHPREAYDEQIHASPTPEKQRDTREEQIDLPSKMQSATEFLRITETYGEGFKQTEIPNQYSIKIYVNTFAGSKTADRRAKEEIGTFMKNEGCTSYEIVNRRYNFFPSYYEYTVQFRRQ